MRSLGSIDEIEVNRRGKESSQKKNWAEYDDDFHRTEYSRIYNKLSCDYCFNLVS